MKRLLTTSLFLLLCLVAFGQAKKPTIMVVPSDAWCLRNGYVTEYDNYGTKERVSDYQTALLKDADVRTLIAKMGDIMASREFPIQSLEQELRRLKNEEVELSLITASATGAAVMETPLEQLSRTAKADIILDLDFQIRKNGPRRQVTFTLTALDASTSKIISGNTGAGTPSVSAPLTTLLEESVLSFMDGFTAQLQRHFDDMFANGREGTITLRCFDGSPVDFETELEYNGQTAELADIVGVWFELNAQEGRFTEATRSTNVLRYTQVRMPLYGKSLSGKEVAQDATMFARGLANFLKRDPYNIEVKIMPKGLGEVWLILGDK